VSLQSKTTAPTSTPLSSQSKTTPSATPLSSKHKTLSAINSKKTASAVRKSVVTKVVQRSLQLTVAPLMAKKTAKKVPFAKKTAKKEVLVIAEKKKERIVVPDVEAIIVVKQIPMWDLTHDDGRIIQSFVSKSSL
jgi:hypothetical protein